MERGERSLAVVLEAPGRIAVREAPVPDVGEPWVEMELGACGICGSDVRYYQGENPWSLHTLGRNIPSPPNMILGHEVAGTVVSEGGRRAAILAYKACGVCSYCRSDRENLCAEMQHFGHGAGWGERDYYPGGMARRFRIWKGFAYDIPESLSFEEATFLDGLAVAVHAVRRGAVGPGMRVGVIGLGPIGMLAAQVARAFGAAEVCGCDQAELPVRLAGESGFDRMVQAGSGGLVEAVRPAGGGGSAGGAGGGGLDVVLDTVGSEETVTDGAGLLAPSGRLVLLAVHEGGPVIAPLALSRERVVMSSANNLYREFPQAIELMASGAVRVAHLVTHRFPLERAVEAFDLLVRTGRTRAFKVVLTPR